MQKNLKVFLFFISLIPAFLYGQNTLEEYKIEQGWYRYDDGINISKQDFLETYKNTWGLIASDELRIISSEQDDLAYTHYKYRQYYQGYEVEHTDLFLHYHSGLWVGANALVAQKLTLETENPISEESALATVLSYVNATEYAWENQTMENELKEETGDTTATHFPVGTLLLHHEYGKPISNQYYHFAWRFEIYTAEPMGHFYVYVDANTGNILSQHSLILSCNDKPGTGSTLYNGTQNITVNKRIFDFTLEECGNRKIHTKWGWGANPDVIDNNGNYGANDIDATSAHWAAEKTWDYYKSIHNRSGTNGSNRQLKILANENNTNAIDNAYWHLSAGNNDKIHIGKYVSNGNSLACVDIVAHEFTHGITGATANLVYQGESGALNESFSDIFGAMVERGVQPSVGWIHGDDPNPNPKFLRSLQDPTVFTYTLPAVPCGGGGSGIPYPDTYQVGGWYFGLCDFEGVHLNSSVQNKFYYLLAAGGTQNGITVIGIGATKAEKIAFRSLTVYLQQNSQYADARAAWISAAIDLHGNCSFGVIQVINAWRAVGVNGPANQPFCIQLLTPTHKGGMYCNNSTISLTATTNLIPPVSYSWNVPLGVITSSQNGGQATFTALAVPQTTISVSASNSNATLTSAPITFNTKFCRLANPNGYEPFAKEDIILYPNPANESIIVEFNDINYEKGTVTIFDMQEKELSNNSIESVKSKIDISYLKSGIYIVRVSSQNIQKILN